MIQELIATLDKFFEKHTTVKSTARALVTAVVAAVLFEFGLDGFVGDVIGPVKP